MSAHEVDGNPVHDEGLDPSGAEQTVSRRRLMQESALAAGAIHEEESVVGDVFECQTTTYTVTSGTLKAVFHEGGSASGNFNFGTSTGTNCTTPGFVRWG